MTGTIQASICNDAVLSPKSSDASKAPTRLEPQHKETPTGNVVFEVSPPASKRARTIARTDQSVKGHDNRHNEGSTEALDAGRREAFSPPKRNRRWSIEEEVELFKAVQCGQPWATIAKRLSGSRSIDACYFHWYRVSVQNSGVVSTDATFLMKICCQKRPFLLESESKVHMIGNTTRIGQL